MPFEGYRLRQEQVKKMTLEAGVSLETESVAGKETALTWCFSRCSCCFHGGQQSARGSFFRPRKGRDLGKGVHQNRHHHPCVIRDGLAPFLVPETRCARWQPKENPGKEWRRFSMSRGAQKGDQ